MPEICRFFGIIIAMYHDEHNPPHFHAKYGGQQMEVGLSPIAVRAGGLPPRATSMVLEWAALHQQELLANWQHCRQGESPAKVEPLE